MARRFVIRKVTGAEMVNLGPTSGSDTIHALRLRGAQRWTSLGWSFAITMTRTERCLTHANRTWHQKNASGGATGELRVFPFLLFSSSSFFFFIGFRPASGRGLRTTLPPGRKRTRLETKAANTSYDAFYRLVASSTGDGFEIVVAAPKVCS